MTYIFYNLLIIQRLLLVRRPGIKSSVGPKLRSLPGLHGHVALQTSPPALACKALKVEGVSNWSILALVATLLEPSFTQTRVSPTG